LPTADSVDVLLLLEGTFPYVAGGVSSWVNQIIRGFPELRFGAIFIGSRPQDYGDMRYALPDNLVHLEVTYPPMASPLPWTVWTPAAAASWRSAGSRSTTTTPAA
jgi:hypothetical protein